MLLVMRAHQAESQLSSTCGAAWEERLLFLACAASCVLRDDACRVRRSCLSAWLSACFEVDVCACRVSAAAFFAVCGKGVETGACCAAACEAEAISAGAGVGNAVCTEGRDAVSALTGESTAYTSISMAVPESSEMILIGSRESSESSAVKADQSGAFVCCGASSSDVLMGKAVSASESADAVAGEWGVGNG